MKISQSDLGLMYDTKYVYTETVQPDGYDPIHVLTTDNKPFDVATMIIEAMYEGPPMVWDLSADIIIEDVEINFGHPADPVAYSLGGFFWYEVSRLVAEEQVRDYHETIAYADELRMLRHQEM
jgi:hypothetical protein